jgi:2,4-dienoyl-CoA reductase-like NADH-dependent reductase (Old Yellow Enzyme family)
VFEAMRAQWPSDRPMGVRVSATDWVDGGWDIEQTVVFARALAERGCDWIDASSGGVLHAGISPAWRVEALRDLDNDGKADVVWRNTQNGDINGWIMNGLTKSRGGFVRNANMQWSVLVP